MVQVKRVIYTFGTGESERKFTVGTLGLADLMYSRNLSLLIRIRIWNVMSCINF